MKRFAFSLLGICLSLQAFPQAETLRQKDRSGTQRARAELIKNDPEYRASLLRPYESRKVDQNSTFRMPFDSGIKYIPVVFHVIHNPGVPVGQAENISMSKIEGQIRILNEDFRKLPGTNGDGNGVDTKIEFFLAQRDPNGNCSDGVNRIASTLTNNHSPNQTVQLKNLSRWDPTRYLNIWVINTTQPGSIVSYAYNPPPSLPFSPGFLQRDGIVIRYTAVGDEQPVLALFELGHQLTHEVGHYLDLYSTYAPDGTVGCFGMNDGNCNTSGDFVCDTPPVDDENSLCPTGHNSCSESTTATGGDIPDLIDNYMDMTSDSCRSMFTEGQRKRMDSTLRNIRFQIWDSISVINAGFGNCLGIEYCESNSLDSSQIQITNVSFKSVNNSSSGICAGYSVYHDQFDTELRDSTFNLSVTTAGCGGSTPGNNQIAAYFDWNWDGDFDDAGEEYIVKSFGSGTGLSSISIQVPQNAAVARIGVRIVCSQSLSISPCGTYAFGETEDYAMNIEDNPPTILDFFPKTGQANTTVTIIGDKLTYVDEVKFNGIDAFAYTVLSDDTISAVAPGSTTGPIQIQTPSGNDDSDTVFTYLVQSPTINQLVPDSGLVGALVNIQGANFFGFTGVEFNGVPATNVVGVTSTLITADVPVGAIDGPIKVLHPNGDVISAQSFNVLEPIPTINIQASPANVCSGDSTLLTFVMPIGTGPFVVEYTDAIDTFLLVNVPSGSQARYQITQNKTYTVTYFSDIYHENPNPNATKNIVERFPGIADFNFTANNLQVSFNNTSSGTISYFWDFGDGNISTNPNPTHTYSSGGTYDVCLVSSTTFNCPDTICQTLSVTVGIENQLENGWMNLFPNPANEELTLKLNLKETGEMILELFSSEGKKLQSQSVFHSDQESEYQFNLNGLRKGVYLVKITTAEGKSACRRVQIR